METYYLAIDIGASSGRHILGCMRDGKLITEEIYRFPNGIHKKDGSLCWDLDALFSHIKYGLKICKEIGKIPVSVGIDTWAVDFVLLDKDNQPLTPAVSYRDGRTKGMIEKTRTYISDEALYARNGLQRLVFNSIYQLMALKEENNVLDKAMHFLMIPDYFHYLLTGIYASEYTNATTTGLVNHATHTWDQELIDILGFPRHIFEKILPAGSTLGEFRKEIAEEIGYTTKVVLPATHDTASAVMALPTNEAHTMYISSGTWSLMGIERMGADIRKEASVLGYTNEGGYAYRFRFLKNIMGLWMIQEVAREFDNRYSFAQLVEMADIETIESIIDCNASVFLAPASMIEAVQNACEESGQEIPKTAGQIARVIYRSLASCYVKTATQLEDLSGVTYTGLHIVGGGSRAEYLNRVTAEFLGKPVYAGPAEATALGNLMAQMITDRIFADLEEARVCVSRSFDMRIY